MLEEELHGVDLEELVHVEHLVRAGQPVRLDVTHREFQVGLVLEFGQRLHPDELAFDEVSWCSSS